MAEVTNLSGDDAAYYIGTDHLYAHHVKNLALTASIDINGWTLSWMVKRNSSDADAAALLTKTTVSGIVIAGTFNATPATNAQRATVTVEDSDTLLLNPGLYSYELKRMDAGFEAVLVTGLMEFRQGVIR